MLESQTRQVHMSANVQTDPNLTEKVSRFHVGVARKALCPLRKANKTKLIVEAGFRKLPSRRPRHFMFGAQPLTQPFAGIPQCYVTFAFALWLDQAIP
jgi:hypothetical protein